MILGIALAGMLAHQDLQRVELVRVRDTYITSQEAESNYGRLPTLVGSQTSAILLDFPELRDPRFTGRIARATLSLQTLGTDTPEIRSVSLIKRPWHEGGGPMTERLLPEGSRSFGATWNARVDGINSARWSVAGGRSEDDAEIITDLTGARDGERFLILGLQQAVQMLRDRPNRYYGLRIDFNGTAEFESSEREGVGPRLLLDVEDWNVLPTLAIGWIGRDVDVNEWPSNGSMVPFELEVCNMSETVFSGLVAEWILDGVVVRVSEPFQLEGGRTHRVRTELEWQSDRIDRRWPLLGARVRSADSQESLAYLAVPMSGIPISISPEGWDRLVEQFGPAGAGVVLSQANWRLNEVVLPWSRFSTTPQGPMEGIQIGRQSSPLRIRSAVPYFVDEDAAAIWLVREAVSAATGIVENFASPGYGEEWPIVDEALAPPTTSELLPFAGVLPDTRDDGFWSTPVPLPTPFYVPSLAGATPLPYHAQLSRSEASILQKQIGKPLNERFDHLYNVPSALFMRVFDSLGMPLGSVPVTLYRVDRGRLDSILWQGATSRQGAIFVSSAALEAGEHPANPFGQIRPDGSNSWLLAVAEKNGQRSHSWIPLWLLWDEFYRGDGRNGFIELRFELPTSVVDESANLAFERVVSDSEGRFPAQLSAVVDGSSETALTVPAGDGTYWIEIDLGRDRPVAAVEIEFGDQTFEQAIIAIHKTGQTAAAGQRFGVELSVPARLLRQRSSNTVRFYGPEILGRYVRVLAPRRVDAEIVQIRIFGAAP